MGIGFQPSPALAVKGDTPTGKCVQLMKKYNVGSLVVLGNDEEEGIIGIFTERDLIHKIELIQDDPNWSRPIRSVMTVPVTTITLDKLRMAGETMIRHRIRHLPVVTSKAANGAEGQSRLLGIVTMRDLFIFQSTRRLPQPRASDEKGLPTPVSKVGIIANDPSLEELFGFLFSNLYSLQVKRIPLSDNADASNVLQEITESGILIFDIDGWDPKNWAKALQLINMSTEAPLTIVAMSPAKHDKKAFSVLQKLSQNPKFLMFTKPIDIVSFFRTMTEKVPALGGKHIQDLLTTDQPDPLEKA